MLEGILVTMLQSAAYDVIKEIVAPYLPSGNKEISDDLIKVIEKAADQFHMKNGDKYGTPSSSFLSIEKNWEIIMRNIFYGNDNLNEHQLEITGLGISSNEAKIGAREFVSLLKAEMKKNWKIDKIIKEKDFMKNTTEMLSDLSNKFDQFSSVKIPIAYINKTIQDEITNLKKSRHFEEFDTISNVLTLVNKLNTGDLSGGSNYIKSWALAWCSRFLISQEHKIAIECLKQSKLLGTCDDNIYAEAFVKAKDGNLKGAVALLNPINSDLKRSITLQINTSDKEEKSIIEWLQAVEFSYEDFDSEGKAYILTRFITASFWDETTKIIDIINESDFEETPVLYHLAAISYLAVTVPLELRETLVRQIPFDIVNFPLFEDSASIKLRQNAQQLFLKAAESAHQLKLYNSETMSKDYALWLKLRDPSFADDGRRELVTNLNTTEHRLRLVPFALQFGVELSLEAIEKEINREIALNGEVTRDAALARLALVFIQSTPGNMATYIEKHSKDLSKYVNRQFLISLQIEMLSKAGLRERAKDCLNLLIGEGLSKVEEGRIRRIIAESEGTDPVESRKVQFEESNSLHDLEALVQALELNKDWLYLCEYGEMLFERTQAISDAERLAGAFNNTDNTNKLIEFVENHNEFLEHSKDLRLMYCWALYREGNLIEARLELSKFNNLDEDGNLRKLQISLAISLGDWNSLSAFVANEIKMKEKRTAQELLSSAQLALHVNLHSHAEELINEAVLKSKKDPLIISSAYFLAVNAGFEDSYNISKSFHEVIESSDSKGPLQKISLQELLERKPEWERHESKIWESLRLGEIPLFLVAESLNSSLINLILFQACSNQTQSDLRYKTIIPVFSGNVQKRVLNDIKTVGLDVSTLILLSYFDLLKRTLETFDEIFIAHSTLIWLFEEQKQILFHQPSRINKAKKIQSMIANGSITKLNSTSSINSDLVEVVGDELATFIAEAVLIDPEYSQKLVITPYPVSKLGSFMEEEADLQQYSSIMSSCLSVVYKLREKGEITKEEERKAVTFLQMHEKPWPNQPEITDGATLYLDSLTVHFFQELGIFEKLSLAGFKIFISSKSTDEVNELIRYENISDNIIDVIERIRETLSEGINNNKVKVGRQVPVESKFKHQETPSPSIELFTLVSYCDALVIDDRYFNQHLTIGDSSTQIITTLDILDILLAKGKINADEKQEFRTKLRRAGYFFIPVIEEELFSQLVLCKVKNNKVIENAELKAIRENILRIRMSNWLQLPNEASWLNLVYQTFTAVLKKLWKEPIANENLIVYSEWVLEQLDICGWAHSFGKEIGGQIIKSGRGASILTLLHPPIDVDEKVVEAYWNWIEARVLKPLKEESYELYNWLMQWYDEEVISTVSVKLLSEFDRGTYGNIDHSKVVYFALQRIIPPILLESLLEKQSFRDSFRLKGDIILSLGNEDINIQRSELYGTIRESLELNTTEMNLLDYNGDTLHLKRNYIDNTDFYFSIIKNNKTIVLPDYRAFSNNRKIRLDSISSYVLDFNLPDSSFEKWHDILSDRALNDNEIDDFHSDIDDTPIFIERLIYNHIIDGVGDLSSLVPPSKRYYERLVGEFKDSKSIIEYASHEGKKNIEQLLNWNPHNGFLLSLYLSSHSTLTKEITNNIQVDNEEIIKALHYIEESGDMLSQLGVVEICLELINLNSEFEGIVIGLIKRILDDTPESDFSHFTLFSKLFILVDGELARLRLFALEPPFYRRLASMAQAALIHRQLIKLKVNIKKICEWADQIGTHFFNFQTFEDMRLEPRWNPDLATSDQLKNEFIGRIMHSAFKNKDIIPGGALFNLLFGETDSIMNLSKSICTQFPGPLEGTESITTTMIPEIKQVIDDQLMDEEVSISTFIGLVNSALVFSIPPNHVKKAIEALEFGNYRLSNADENSQIVAVAKGLALVAAVSRSKELSNSVYIFARRHRNDVTYDLTIDDDLRLCLISAASHENKEEWVSFVGEWFTEITFSPLDKKEAERLLFYLNCMCFLVPELWVTCGRAEAALKALTFG